MENTRKFYIVSFGDSQQYRLTVEIDPEDENAHESKLINLEKELNAYLKQRFPEDTFAYFTTPKVTEISADHEDQYASYPLLDNKAMDAIKKVLVREVQVMESEKELDRNAP